MPLVSPLNVAGSRTSASDPSKSPLSAPALGLDTPGMEGSSTRAPSFLGRDRSLRLSPLLDRCRRTGCSGHSAAGHARVVGEGSCERLSRGDDAAETCARGDVADRTNLRVFFSLPSREPGGVRTTNSQKGCRCVSKRTLPYSSFVFSCVSSLCAAVTIRGRDGTSSRPAFPAFPVSKEHETVSSIFPRRARVPDSQRRRLEPLFSSDEEDTK